MRLKLKRRILDYGVAAVLLVLPILILSASLKDKGDRNGLDKAFLRLTSPLQAGASWIVEGGGGLWNGYVWLVDVEDENVELRQDNERLRVQLADAERRAARVETLERLVGLKDKLPSDTIGARVVSASLSPRFRMVRVRLDRGEGEVEHGMPVMSASGLVGRVSAVYDRHADVELVTNTEFSVAVEVARTGARGVLSGDGGDDSFRCSVEYIGKDGAIEVGDELRTSGLGGRFPAGLVVGTVASAEQPEVGLYQKVAVTPSVDFSDLSAVMVLRASPPPPDPSAGASKKSPVARGVGLD